MSGRASKSDGKGAAEEPEPPLDDAGPPSSAASYDPAIYQRPHPDDRGGGGGGGKKGAAVSKAGGKTKTKGKDDGSHRCANCDKPGATSRCGRCGVERYCDRNCQKVGLQRQRHRAHPGPAKPPLNMG